MQIGENKPDNRLKYFYLWINYLILEVINQMKYVYKLQDIGEKSPWKRINWNSITQRSHLLQEGKDILTAELGLLKMKLIGEAY